MASNKIQTCYVLYDLVNIFMQFFIGCLNWPHEVMFLLLFNLK